MHEVLVVESNRMIAKLLKDTIEELGGFRVVLSSSLDAAVERIDHRDSKFFLVVTSLVLPGSPDGRIVDALLERSAPVVVLTSSINDSQRKSMLDKGVVDYVLKDRESAAHIAQSVKRYLLNQGIKVLCVDDSVGMRRIIRAYLEPHGFHVLEAANGYDGVKILEEESDVRVVVTDYEMPDMNGLDFCQKVRKRWRSDQLAIIGISSASDKLLSVKFLKHGANDFLTKPFQREELYCRAIQNLQSLEFIEELQASLSTIRTMNERLKRDLEAASTLQLGLLPSEPPNIPGVNVAFSYKPCDELSGDTFNVFSLGDDLLALFVVDVSGHGVPAALLSVTLCRLLTPDDFLCEATDDGERISLPPGEVCKRLNRRFPMDTDTMQYFTITYAVLNVATRRLTYCAAGHPGPLIIRAKGDNVAMRSTAMAIGFAPGVEYAERSVELAPGDRFFLYSDGIVEARSVESEEFGTHRLADVLKSNRGKSMDDAMRLVDEAVMSFCFRINDDRTLVGVEIL
ncbi:MAG: phosphoserine phosphatase RsbU/P [Desulfovibrionales bacterium]|nr:phosphoserine phosphatase RsbU/P [Desulfovibrionales bacterium]